jgi:hypothetical protein
MFINKSVFLLNSEDFNRHVTCRAYYTKVNEHARINILDVNFFIILNCRESNPGHPSCSPSLYRLLNSVYRSTYSYEGLKLYLSKVYLYTFYVS